MLSVARGRIPPLPLTPPVRPSIHEKLQPNHFLPAHISCFTEQELQHFSQKEGAKMFIKIGNPSLFKIIKGENRSYFLDLDVLWDHSSNIGGVCKESMNGGFFCGLLGISRSNSVAWQVDKWGFFCNQQVLKHCDRQPYSHWGLSKNRHWVAFFRAQQHSD